MIGKVSFWCEKGYGFVRPSEPGKAEVFVHASALSNGEPGKRRLTPGQLVEFELSDFRGKPVAVNVQSIGLPEIEREADAEQTR